MIFTGASGNDPKNDFEAFLRSYAWVLCVAVVVIILLTILIIFVIKKPKKSSDKKKAPIDSNQWVDALGGIENILEISATGSRLSVKAKDPSLINQEALKELGVSNIIKMSEKLILVTELDNQKIVENIKNLQQN